MKVQKVFDVPITLGRYNDFIKELILLCEKPKGSYVCLLNVHMIIEAQRMPGFKNVLKEADIVAPDGKPITWALKFLNNIQQDRVAGMDLFPDLLAEMQQAKKSVFFYGGSEELLTNTKEYIKKKYPNLIVAGAIAPPFRPLAPEETEEAVKKINSSGAKIVFVVLGCPKQEMWMWNLKDKINAVLIGIGGALPVAVGSKKRAPVWMQKSGLEWLFRLVQEPRRLFKRYALTNMWFIFLFIKAYLKKPMMKSDS